MHPKQIKDWLDELSPEEQKHIQEIQFLANEIKPHLVLELIYKAVDAISEHVQEILPSIPCQSGCSICCEEQEPELYPVEMQLIQEMYPEAAFKTEGSGCGFLKNGRCLVYSARPVSCRLKGVAFHQRESALSMLKSAPKPWTCTPEGQRIQALLPTLRNPIKYMYLPLLNQYQQLIQDIDGTQYSKQKLSGYFSESK